MPYTNNSPEGSGKGSYHHVWLHDGTTIEAGNTEAVCGQVHANPATQLVRVSELERVDHEDVVSFLAADHTCGVCADVAREELGLPPRDLTEIPGVGDTKADALQAHGFETPADLRRVSQMVLSETVPEIGNALAARIKANVGNEEDVVRP